MKQRVYLLAAELLRHDGAAHRQRSGQLRHRRAARALRRRHNAQELQLRHAALTRQKRRGTRHLMSIQYIFALARQIVSCLRFQELVHHFLPCFPFPADLNQPLLFRRSLRRYAQQCTKPTRTRFSRATSGSGHTDGAASGRGDDGDGGGGGGAKPKFAQVALGLVRCRLRISFPPTFDFPTRTCIFPAKFVY